MKSKFAPNAYFFWGKAKLIIANYASEKTLNFGTFPQTYVFRGIVKIKAF